jgi:hypothetical protein
LNMTDVALKNCLTRIFDSLPPIGDSLLVNRYRTVVAGQLYWVWFFRTGHELPKQMPGMTELETQNALEEAKPWGHHWSKVLDLCIGVGDKLAEQPGAWSNPMEWWAKIIIEDLGIHFANIAEHVNGGPPKGYLRTITRRDKNTLRALKNLEFKRSTDTEMGALLEAAQVIVRPKPKDSPAMVSKRKSFKKAYWLPFLSIFEENSTLRSKHAVLMVEKITTGGEHVIKFRLGRGTEIQVDPAPTIQKMKRGGRPRKNIPQSGRGFQESGQNSDKTSAPDLQ